MSIRMRWCIALWGLATVCFFTILVVGYHYVSIKHHIQETQIRSLHELGTVTISSHDSIYQLNRTLHNDLIMLVGLSVLFVLLLLISLLVWNAKHLSVLHDFILVIAMVPAIGIGCIWYIEQSFIAEPDAGFIPITSAQELKEHLQVSLQGIKDPLLVKVGILLTMVRYKAGDPVIIGGYVWQRYPLSCPEHIERNYLMPDRYGNSTKLKITDVKTNNEEFVLWFFSGKFNQEHFQKNRFPFDEQDIRLLITPYPSGKDSVCFVPDIMTYHTIDPWRMPGVCANVGFNDRFAFASYFAFHKIEPIIGKFFAAGSSNLYFIIGAGHSLQSIIITYLLPLLLALLALHACLVFVKQRDNINEVFLAATIFLGTSLLHTSMRTAFEMGGAFSYLEYYYTLIYLLCCGAVCYIFWHGSKTKLMQLLNMHNGFLIKMLFIPTYLFVAFVITAFIFYD